MKEMKDRRIRNRKVLAFLLLAPLAFSMCENRHPEMDIVMETDFSEIIEAIKSSNKSLSDKLALIEAALQQGLADNQAAMEQVRQAVASLSGTMEEKLAVVEAAVKAQATSLETKLALVEAAVSNGFADSQAQQELLKQAIASLSGSADEKIALIEAAIKARTSGLETKIGLIEAALKEGFADGQTAIGLLQTSLNALKTQVEDMDDALSKDIDDVVAKLGTLSATLTTGQISKTLSQILAAVQDQTDYSKALADIKKTIEELIKELSA